MNRYTNNVTKLDDNTLIDPNNVKLSALNKMESYITQTEEDIIINKSKILYGVFLVIAIGISWAASTQFAQRVQTKTSVTIPPFALMWFTTSFKTLCVIPVLIAYFKDSKAEYMEMNTPQSISFESDSSHHKKVTEIFNAEEYIENNSIVYGSNNNVPSARLSTIDVTPNNLRICFIYLLFYTLWTGANYCYLRALLSNSATIVTALFSSNNMFIYVLSICILQEIFSFLRMFAVISAIIGICLITLHDTDDKIVIIGSILAIMSSIFAAVYKVYFKKIFGSIDVMNLCKFLGFIGLFNALFMWILIVILDVFKCEILPNDTLSEWPWCWLLATAASGLTFDFLVNFGIMYTYPLFIALGIIIGIPFNLTADILFNRLVITAFELIGVLCICAGFLIIVLTDLHGKGANASFRK